MSCPGQIIRGVSGALVAVRCRCGETMTWGTLIDTEDRCRRCGYDWQYQPFGDPDSVEMVRQ